MLIETSLIAKVVIILAPQLLIMLGIPIYIVLKARKAVFANKRVLGLRIQTIKWGLVSKPWMRAFSQQPRN